jgi:hypothetical protein
MKTVSGACVGVFDAGAVALQGRDLGALGGVPVVGEHDLVAVVERVPRERGADVAGAENEQ